jgi:hypothetical protein
VVVVGATVVLVDVLVEVLVDVLVELLLVVVVVGTAVLVVVLVLLLELLVVVVVGVKPTVMSIEFVHTPTEVTLIIVVPLGTTYDVYPACKADADIFVSNGMAYPPTFE